MLGDWLGILEGVRPPVHKYLAWVLTGRITWHPYAFFMVHAVATAATFRVRAKGLGGVAGLLGTLAFHCATAWLFLVRLGEAFGDCWS